MRRTPRLLCRRARTQRPQPTQQTRAAIHNKTALITSGCAGAAGEPRVHDEHARAAGGADRARILLRRAARNTAVLNLVMQARAVLATAVLCRACYGRVVLRPAVLATAVFPRGRAPEMRRGSPRRVHDTTVPEACRPHRLEPHRWELSADG